jgi:hypothetical protein
MQDGPLISLVIAVVPVLSLVLGQWLARRSESENWQRQLEREREVWARESRSREFELRKQSYARLLQEAWEYELALEDVVRRPDLFADRIAACRIQFVQLRALFGEVELVGTEDISRRAGQLLREQATLLTRLLHLKEPPPDLEDRWREGAESRRRLVQTVRADLRLQDGAA